MPFHSGRHQLVLLQPRTLLRGQYFIKLVTLLGMQPGHFRLHCTNFGDNFPRSFRSISLGHHEFIQRVVLLMQQRCIVSEGLALRVA